MTAYYNHSISRSNWPAPSHKGLQRTQRKNKHRKLSALCGWSSGSFRLPLDAVGSEQLFKRKHKIPRGSHAEAGSGIEVDRELLRFSKHKSQQAIAAILFDDGLESIDFPIFHAGKMDMYAELL